MHALTVIISVVRFETTLEGTRCFDIVLNLLIIQMDQIIMPH